MPRTFQKLLLLSLLGAVSVAAAEKFDRFFSWSIPRNDREAELARQIGVTDIFIGTRSRKSGEWIDLARKHGFKVYATFTPMMVPGLPPQEVTPAVRERRELMRTGGQTKKPRTAAERKAFRKRAAEMRTRYRYRYGGEPEKENEALESLYYPPPCFLGPEALEKSKKVLAALCADRRLSGVAFDFIGYADYRGCRCPSCQKRYKAYLKARKSADTPAARDAFFLRELVDYNNALADYIRKIRPDMKVADHVYPVFLPEPLYGNRLNLDYCGQTAAWYFLWPPEKIRAYTKVICSEEKKYHPRAVGVPFVGLYAPETHPGFDRKSPERLELELKNILAGGGKHLMMLSPRDVWRDPAYVRVFRRHCARSQ